MPHKPFSFGFGQKYYLILVVLFSTCVTHVSCADFKPVFPLLDKEAAANPVLSTQQKEEILRNIFAASADSAENEGPTSRIINGDYAQKGDYPWFVLLISEEGFATCGGFLIAPEFVATAAHCLVLPEGASPVRYVAIGALCIADDNCGQELEFFIIDDSNKLIVDIYDPVTVDNDYGLIQLSNRSNIKPVRMDDGTYSELYTSGKDNLWSTGKFFVTFWSVL